MAPGQPVLRSEQDLCHVLRTDLADLDGIHLTAHQFQRVIDPKAHDARLVVIGDRQFGFAIHASTPEARLDFRYDYSELELR